VKRFSRFQVDSPWRISTSLYMGLGWVREVWPVSGRPGGF
jgi:hypothetical protein